MSLTNKWNVIVIDWCPLSLSPYHEARLHIKIVSEQIKLFTIFISKLMSIQFDKIHFIGHSLGAHIAGFVGSEIINEYNKSVSRITGLDPAGVLFEWPYLDPIEEKLDMSDAEFVDVIHTNADEAGIADNVGHVDYYPNGGKRQPGCGSGMLLT